MFGKKVFAAMLATILGASLFGANAAKAQLNLDDDTGAITYATETLVGSTDLNRLLRGHGHRHCSKRDGQSGARWDLGHYRDYQV